MAQSRREIPRGPDAPGRRCAWHEGGLDDGQEIQGFAAGMSVLKRELGTGSVCKPSFGWVAVVERRTPQDGRRHEPGPSPWGILPQPPAGCNSGIAPAHTDRRGHRRPVRAAASFLARKHTEATLAGLAPILRLSRPESVPNLMRRYSGRLE